MLILFFFLFSASAFAQSYGLDELYQAALQNTGRLKDSELQVEIAKTQENQALAQVFPRFSANTSLTERDEVPVGPFGEGTQRNSFLTLTQPLFQGGAEYFLLNSTNLLTQVAELNENNQKIQLYLEVATAYYEVLSLRKQKEILLEQEKNLAKQVETLKKRVRIGRNRSTDLLSSQSRLSRIQADRAINENTLHRSELMLQKLCGLEQILDLKEVFASESQAQINTWQSRIADSPILKAGELSLKSAKAQIDIETASLLPSVDLEANYYIDRAGILADSKWDAILTATWEFSLGGEEYFNRKEQVLEKRRLELGLADTKRNLLQDFKSLRKQWLAQKKVIESLQLANELAQKNYLQQVKDERRGLVNQLDVLQSLDDAMQIERAFYQEQYNSQILWQQLRATAGVMP